MQNLILSDNSKRLFTLYMNEKYKTFNFNFKIYTNKLEKLNKKSI